MSTGYNLVYTGSDIYICVCAFIRYILGKIRNNNTLTQIPFIQIYFIINVKYLQFIKHISLF